MALGTVQFGVDYGINNKRGKIPEGEVFEILSRANLSGIDTIDTADAYGNSEFLVGKYIAVERKQFKIVSKCGMGNIRDTMNSSLKKLNVNSFYGYMVHNFSDFLKNPDLWNDLLYMKAEGKVRKIGFSLYLPSEIEEIFNRNFSVDLLQFPYSVFDQRFSGYFSKLKQMNIEIHTRSVFLQGLVFKNQLGLDPCFKKVSEKIGDLRKICKEENISISSLYINFALLNKHIDKVVVGVDSLDNLNEILKAINDKEKVKRLYEKIADFREDDENVLLPYNWKKRSVL